MQNKLTRREKEIFDALLGGAVPKEIAGTLKISYETVISHQQRLYRKLNVHNINELLEKYRNKKEKSIRFSGNMRENLLQPKILVFTGLIVLLCLFIFLGVRYFSGNQIDINPDIITFEDGTVWTLRTFDPIYMRAGRGTSVGPDGTYYHEHYQSWDSIKLRDIYNGSYENLTEGFGKEEFQIKMSGTIDIELEHLKIDFFYLFDNNETIPLGDSSAGGFFKIGPNEFSIEFTIYRNTFWEEVEIQEGGEVVVTLMEIIKTTKDGQDIGRSFGEIPEDVPDGTIMAVIQNLRIEPVR